MKKIGLILLPFFILHFPTFSQQDVKAHEIKKVILNESVNIHYLDSVLANTINLNTISKLEIPKTNSQDSVIFHLGYSFLYNETHEQSNWVAYTLTKEKTHKIYERTNKFLPDPCVKTGTANDNDFAASGYDRGHLAPASDMGWSLTSMTESFYYSNMSPQTASFNRGIWKKLEELVRTWAVENDSVYIVTGPLLTNELQTIGANKVSVPNYFYKVILDCSEPDLKGIGFIIPNKGSNEPLQHFAVSIDSVEKFTGINFFPLLPDEKEEQIEKTLCISCWSWTNYINENPAKSEEPITSYSIQCKSATKSGKQCRNKTTNKSGHCYLHEK